MFCTNGHIINNTNILFMYNNTVTKSKINTIPEINQYLHEQVQWQYPDETHTHVIERHHSRRVRHTHSFHLPMETGAAN